MHEAGAGTIKFRDANLASQRGIGHAIAGKIERYADVYTSRVSNLLHLTPFGYLRAPRGNLPHDAQPQ